MENEMELPSGWAETKLADICEIMDNKRKPINGKEREQRIHGKKTSDLYPYYGATGQVGYIDDYLLDGEYVLLGEDGAPFLEVFKNKAYIVKGKLWVNNHAHILRAIFSNLYVLHYLNQLNYRGYVTGTTRLKLNQSSMKDIPILLPPLPEQYRIVTKIEEIFSEIEEGIESLEAAQQKLKVYRQAVLKWAFEGKLTESWRKAQIDLYSADELLEKIGKERVKESKENSMKLKIFKCFSDKELYLLPLLPSKWKWINIEQILATENNAIKAGPFGSSLRKEYYVSKGYKVYGQEQVIAGNPKYGDYYISSEKYEELKTNKIKPHDILISLVGTVGKVLILTEGCQEGIINPRLIKISLNRNYYIPVFFKYYFESAVFKSFYSTKTQGSTMEILNTGIIKVLPFPLCSIKEQQRIIHEIESRLSVCDKMEECIKQSLIQSEALRQSILKKAFEGRLVLQDTNDEPAEKLLERIKIDKEVQKPEKKTTKRRMKK